MRLKKSIVTFFPFLSSIFHVKSVILGHIIYKKYATFTRFLTEQVMESLKYLYVFLESFIGGIKCLKFAVIY